MENNPEIYPEREVRPNEQLRYCPRHPLVAFLLSFLFPGLGQVYNGQIRKAIVLYFLLLLTPFLFGVTKLATYFYGYAGMLTIMLVLWIYGISDAFVQARRKKQYVLKKYNRWYFYLLIVLFMTIAARLYEKGPLSGMRNFTISSPSQLPTMQLGDRVLADMHAYGKKNPDYGHIVLFDRPEAGIWAFRVAGLPGDTVEVVNNILILNGAKSKSTYIRNTIVAGLPVHEYEEEMINGHKHRIYSYLKAGERENVSSEKIVVPDGSYYLLGDNRENALDSRFIGPVPAGDIRGRIVCSLWGRSFDRFNIDFRNK